MAILNRPTEAAALLIALLLAWLTAATVRGAALAANANVVAGEAHFRRCATCHGSAGGGSQTGEIPAIAGQHFKVIVKQLKDFRRKARWDTRMEIVVDRHHFDSPQAIADVARFVAEMRQDYVVGQGTGADLLRGGDTYQERCARCHGAAGRGSDRARVPALAAQHQLYIVRQLQDAADGRRASMSGRHAALAQSMSYEELMAVGDYLARLKRNQSTHP